MSGLRHSRSVAAISYGNHENQEIEHQPVRARREPKTIIASVPGHPRGSFHPSDVSRKQDAKKSRRRVRARRHCSRKRPPKTQNGSCKQKKKQRETEPAGRPAQKQSAGLVKSTALGEQPVGAQIPRKQRASKRKCEGPRKIDWFHKKKKGLIKACTDALPRCADEAPERPRPAWLSLAGGISC